MALHRIPAIRFYFHIVFLIHLEYNGRRTADRLIAEIHRAIGFQIANAVMIDNFKNFCILKAIDTLRFFIVID